MSKINYQKDGIIIDGEFYGISQIISKCNDAKIEQDKLSLLTIEWRGGRGFDGCKEQIVLSADKIEIIKKYMVGRTVYFGEIAGKHSDVYGEVLESEVTVSDDKKVISDFLSEYPSGHTYDHSFLYQFSDSAQDGQYEDMTEEEVKEFCNAF